MTEQWKQDPSIVTLVQRTANLIDVPDCEERLEMLVSLADLIHSRGRLDGINETHAVLKESLLCQ